MEESVNFENIIPNIQGIPAKIKKSHAETFVAADLPIAPMHLHNEIELLYIFSGDFSTRLADGSNYIAYPGEVICINSNVMHSTYTVSEGVLKYGLIQFKINMFDKSESPLNEYLNIIFKSKGKEIEIFRDDEITDFCRFLFDHENEEGTAQKFYITSGIFGIMAALCKCGFLVSESEGVDKVKAKKLLSALDYIDTNFREDISLSDVSTATGMSDYYFCRLFKSTLNMGFVDYLNSVRVYHAIEDLAHTDKSILEIALENGFSSVSYFNRVFKAKNKCSPSEYRKFLR